MLENVHAHTTALRFSASGCGLNDGAGEVFPTTSGDDEALLDDWFYGDCAAPTIVTITRLPAGDFRLLLYPKANGGGVVNATIDVSPPLGTDATVLLPQQIPFPGSFAGWSHGDVVVSATQSNSTLTITFDSDATQGLSGMQLVKLNDSSATGTVYCSGDGSGVTCPCNNEGIFGRGCANVVFPTGARLAATGVPSVSGDTLVLRAISMSGAQSWYFQATERAAHPFGYGILCLGATLIRVGQRPLVNGTSSYPSIGDSALSVKGAIPPSGGTRHYQVWYRQANPPCAPPPASNSNQTNGLTIVWTP